MVFLSYYHSTNHTPSVSPCGLPAPPLGSQGSLCEFALVHSKWYSAYRRKPLRRYCAASPFRGGPQEKNCGDSQGIAAAGFLRGCGQTSPRGRGGEWLHLSRSPGSCITERRAAFSDRSNGRGHAPWRAASALTVAVPPRIHTGFPILRPIPGGT